MTNDELYDILIKRGATRLCHFTKTKSLVHILDSIEGIVASDFIKSDIKNQNDLSRCDGQTDYVCCSLEYPNSWYWKKAVNRDQDLVFSDWVVLVIDLSIIKQAKIKYSPCNAAKNNGYYISEDLSKFNKLFDNPLTIGQPRYRETNMLKCCPTDDQAEILIYKNIPLRYIKSIIAGNENVANNINAILKTLGKNIEIIIAPDVCNTNWSRLVRLGVRPTEEKYKSDINNGGKI